MDTHFLSGTEGGTSEDTKRKLGHEEHSLSVERRERDKSGHQQKARQLGALTPYQVQREGKSQDPGE